MEMKHYKIREKCFITEIYGVYDTIINRYTRVERCILPILAGQPGRLAFSALEKAGQSILQATLVLHSNQNTGRIQDDVFKISWHSDSSSYW